MGVPGFFLWLMKKYKKHQFIYKMDECKEIKDKIKWLCLDANCLIHPKCYEVLGENPDFTNEEKLESKMISRCLEYIEKLVNDIKPSDGLYIAIDGVAPIAKIKQQRSRRFKSINDKSMMDRLKKKHNIPLKKHWNNSKITPGTDFMMKLTKNISEWSKKQSYPIIFSSGNTPGEGEHKILDFIRLRQKKKESGPYVIYGLDADLIFLSLALNRSDVYLLREEQHLNGSSDILNLVDLEEMKSSIISTMKEYTETLEEKKVKIKERDLINDFIFISYFLGNDFLPHYASLDVYDNGLDILLKTYGEMIDNTLEPILNIKTNKYDLIENVDFNQKSFVEFIKLLSEKEEDILKEFNKRKIYNPPLTGSAYEREVQRIETLRFKIKDDVELGKDSFDEYSSRYYEHFFHCVENETIIKISYEYLKGLVWVANYYFKGCPCWDYYYCYDHAPFIKDLNKIVGLIDLSKIKFKLGKPLRPYEQLLCVLPPQSKDLLPYKINNLFNESSPLGHLYPGEFQQDFLYKRKYWQGIPLLPYLEVDLVRKVFIKKIESFDEKDKKKNDVIKEMLFNFNE